MTRTTYFTATSDDEATTAVRGSVPQDDETLISVVAPDSDAFAVLIELITGTELDQLKDDDFTLHNDVAADLEASLTRLGNGLVGEIAARDAAEFAELSGPWQRSGSLSDQEGLSDVAGYLSDLQHLCRHAVAENHAVYAAERS